MTYARINDTIPHTWIVWDMHKELHSHITIQEIGVVRSPSCIENFHIFLEGLRKHFRYVYNLFGYKHKIRKIFTNEQHPMGHCI